MWQIITDECKDLLARRIGIRDSSTIFGIGEELLTEGFPFLEVRFGTIGYQGFEYLIMILWANGGACRRTHGQDDGKLYVMTR